MNAEELAYDLIQDHSELEANTFPALAIRGAVAWVLERHPDWRELGPALEYAFSRLDLEADYKLALALSVPRGFPEPLLPRVEILAGIMAAGLREHLSELA
jgi:hypothetical protein